MRVLHTIASLDPRTGGPARSVPNLALALRRAGVSVALWTPGAQNESWLAPLREAGVEIHSGDLADLPDFDLIHDHGVWLSNNRRVAAHAHARGTPRIVSPRGMLEPLAMNHKKWKKRLAWWLYQRKDLRTASALHATAESEAVQFRKLGFQQRIIVAANGVAKLNPEPLQTHPLEKHTPGARDPGPAGYPESRRSAISDTPPKTALFLSRIHPKKGLPLLVDAWSRIKPKDWRMRIVGPDEGGHRQEVEALVARAGLTDEWTFESEMDGDAKWNCYQEADLFILPTYSENFGICVAEALASGVPVITTTGTPWGGLREHQCGWWISPDAEALANALEVATATSQEDLRAMGERGKAWMSRDFTWGAIAQQMAAAYQGLKRQDRTA
jgi:glycosyltransferase involved in cell wall biosynthesis